ncbi:MAG: DUF4398 domain-containing protein [Rhodanobacteraceae bacterium]
MTANQQKPCAPVAVLIGSFAISLLTASCATTPPPLDQLAAADHSVDAARAAGAPDHAPLDMQMAEHSLADAKAAESSEDYDAAARLAREAQANADLAVGRTRLAKAREAVKALRQQNETLRQSLEAGNGGTSQ